MGGEDDGGCEADFRPLDDEADFLPEVSLASEEDGFDDDAADDDDSEGVNFVMGAKDDSGRDSSAAVRELAALAAPNDDFEVSLFPFLPADNAVIAVEDGRASLHGDADANGGPAVGGDGNAPVIVIFLC